MKIKLSPSDVMPVVISFLEQSGLQKIAKKIKKKVPELSDIPEKKLHKKKLVKIIRFYLKNHNSIYEDLIQTPEKTEEEPALAKRKKSIDNKKTKSSECVDEKSKNKKDNKKTKILEKTPESSEQKASQKVEAPEKLNEKLKDKSFNKKKAIESEVLQENLSQEQQDDDAIQSNANEKRTFFQKIDHSNFEKLKPELKDNSFMVITSSDLLFTLFLSMQRYGAITTKINYRQNINLGRVMILANMVMKSQKMSEEEILKKKKGN